MKREKIDWRLEENNLSITKWMDNKVVYFISNMHNPEKSEGVSRKTKDGTEVVIVGNQVNKDYNKHMGYVDRLLQSRINHIHDDCHATVSIITLVNKKIFFIGAQILELF